MRRHNLLGVTPCRRSVGRVARFSPGRPLSPFFVSDPFLQDMRNGMEYTDGAPHQNPSLEFESHVPLAAGLLPGHYPHREEPTPSRERQAGGVRLPRTARGRLQDLASSRPILTGSWGPTTLPGIARDKSCCSGLASPKRRDPSLARASGDSFRGVHGDNHTPDGGCQCPHRISLTAKPRSTSRHPTAKVEP